MSDKTPLPDRLRASAPEVSAWVSANAGAGKTHLLVSRVLRLLLSGVEPSRILCITYTKAAAAEMRERIYKRLSEWVVLDEAGLHASLEALSGEPPPAPMLLRARTLFARMTDAPEGLRIQTIHSFCQSLLKRFPLEAGVAPYFKVIDDRTTRELLHEAAMRLFSGSIAGADATLTAAMRQLAARMNETSFHDLLKEITANRRRLHALLQWGGREQALARLYRLLQVNPADTEEAYFTQAFAYTPQELEMLRGCAGPLLASAKASDLKTGQALEGWLAQPEARAGRVQEYCAAYLTQEGAPRKTIATRGTLAQPQQQALLAEQARVQAFELRCRALRTATMSAHLLTVAQALLEEYDALKRVRAVADYEDLISGASALLAQGGIAPWVMYKLDGGIDHLLVDEAQDTSHEQWQIARALTGEFFAGEGRAEGVRTVFAVGDVKQSIFSFQGARPELFAHNEEYYSAQVQAALQAFAPVMLPESFRSVRAVLEAVEAVFATPHVATREGAGGLVELWPVIVKEKTEEQGWSMPRSRIRRERPSQLLAEHIARLIKGWLERGEPLASQGRAIVPGDVLILVRRRGELVDALMRRLRACGIPVAGADRLVLSDSLCVQDLLALAGFLLLPEDDLTLAALLKCPLFEIDEGLLFALAHGRGGQPLWHRLRELRHTHAAFDHACALLEELLARADFSPPYELFAYALEVKGGRARFSARMGEAMHDVLDEFLAQALSFEQAHLPTLQGFLHWMHGSDTEIKRDMEQGGGVVRIMTAHAAKGLQARIVILPDTTQPPQTPPKLLWSEEAGAECMLWAASAKDAPQALERLKETRRARELEEYNRLLYVAMTRAEDRLYIMGAQSGNGISAECWHTRAWAALSASAEEVETPTGKGLRISAAQHAATERPAPAGIAPALAPMPPVLRTLAPAEEATQRPLSPSHLLQEGERAPAFSPAANAVLYRRGVVMHRLLQHLPALPPAARMEAGHAMLTRHGVAEAGERAQLLREVLALLEHPEFAAFFGADSLAEVPVAGLVRMEGRTFPIAGQLDRLSVQARDVWVLDYKTNAATPKNTANIPPAYLRQMAAYRALLLGIYPDKTVRCALLWTAGPTLMQLPDEQLHALCQPLTKGAGAPTFPKKALHS